jgi:hypothetical protein
MTLLAAENSRSNFVWNLFNGSPVARQSLASAFPMLAPTLESAASRKTRTSDFAVMDLPGTLGGVTETVDGRAGGPTQLVLNFDANVVKGASFAVSLSSGTLGSTSVSGSTVTINLSGVADAQTLTVNVSDVRHFSTAASGNFSFSIGALVGDTNSDGAVDLTDFTFLASNFNKTGGATLADGDFNVDGNVDLTDFTYLASNFNKHVAAGAPASPALAAPAATTPVAPAAAPLASPIQDDAAVKSHLIDGELI